MASEAPISPPAPQQLQMKDIYDLAKKVGEQFHQLLARFGNTYLAEHISVVVKALEHLEATFEENQRLMVKNGKLMLENDNLAREIIELKATEKDFHELQEKHRREQREKMALTLKVERLEAKNSELVTKLEVMGKFMKTPPASTPVTELTIATHHPLMKPDILSHAHQSTTIPQVSPRSDHHLTNGGTLRFGEDCSNLDVLEVPRINHRLHVMEKELQQTQDKLTVVTKYNQELLEESHALKLQIEEYRAEVALQSLELSKEIQCPYKEDAPRYYKKDLLAVLIERNKLKEEVDRLSDELGITKLELRKYQVHSPTLPANSRYRIQSTIRKPRSQTRVREILDSFTHGASNSANSSTEH